MQNIKADYFCFLLGIGLFTLPPVRLPPLVLLATPAAGLALPVFAGLCCLVAGVAVALTCLFLVPCSLFSRFGFAARSAAACAAPPSAS